METDDSTERHFAGDDRPATEATVLRLGADRTWATTGPCRWELRGDGEPLVWGCGMAAFTLDASEIRGVRRFDLVLGERLAHHAVPVGDRQRITHDGARGDDDQIGTATGRVWLGGEPADTGLAVAPLDAADDDGADGTADEPDDDGLLLTPEQRRDTLERIIGGDTPDDDHDGRPGPGPGTYICPGCGEAFATPRALKRHVAQAHRNETNPDEHLRAHDRGPVWRSYVRGPSDADRDTTTDNSVWWKSDGTEIIVDTTNAGTTAVAPAQSPWESSSGSIVFNDTTNR